jgi:uncharacterized protein YkwD
MRSLYRHALALSLAVTAVLAVRPAHAQSPDQVIDLMNQQRAAYGLAPLAPAGELTQAADRHASDEAANDFSSHTGSDGSDPIQRMTDAGYEGVSYAENIGYAWGSDPSYVWADQDMMDWWMNSPGHRANILNPDFTEVGVSVVDVERTDADGTTYYYRYWCVDFGAR